MVDVVTKSAARKDAAAVGSADWVRVQAEVLLNGRESEYPYAYVREVFADRIVVEAGYANLVEIPYTVDEAASLLSLNTDAAKEVKLAYVPKAQSPVLAGPILYKSEGEDRRLAYAAVLVPGEPDSDGDVVSAEKVEEVAHGFLETYRNIDLTHTLSPADASVAESYIAPADMKVGEYTLPAGSWVMAVKVRDEDVWAAIKDGTLTGYSIMGVRKAALKAASKGEAAYKRTLLSDLGDDWICPFVSIVDAPAVPKAKFYALKSEGQKEGSWISRLFRAEQPSLKAGRKFSESTYTKMKDAATALAALIDEAEKERDKSDAKEESKAEKAEGNDTTPEELQEALGTALAPFAERLTAIETSLTAPAATSETDADEDEADKSEESDLAERIEVMETTPKAISEKLAPATKSRALRGQDTDGKSDEAETPNDRDVVRETAREEERANA